MAVARVWRISALSKWMCLESGALCCRKPSYFCRNSLPMAVFLEEFEGRHRQMYAKLEPHAIFQASFSKTGSRQTFPPYPIGEAKSGCGSSLAHFASENLRISRDFHRRWPYFSRNSRGGTAKCTPNSSHTQFFDRVLAKQGPAKHFRTTP